MLKTLLCAPLLNEWHQVVEVDLFLFPVLWLMVVHHDIDGQMDIQRRAGQLDPF